MTAPAPAPAEMTDAELDQAIIEASRELLAAQRARPRDQQRIDDAYAKYRVLIEERNSRG